MNRTGLLDALAARLQERRPGHPVRVGIDGVCGSGKTTFRLELAARLRRGDRPVVEVSSDGFHNARSVRYRQGRGSARGYYDDAHDFAALEHRVLRPLGPGGSRTVALKVHDLASDVVVSEEAVVYEDAVVLFDCTFLQRGSLRELWDEVIYLEVDPTVARRRGIARDSAALGGSAAAAEAYDRRYLAAWRIYWEDERPDNRASVVIDNTDVDDPLLLVG